MNQSTVHEVQVDGLERVPLPLDRRGGSTKTDWTLVSKNKIMHKYSIMKMQDLGFRVLRV